jgi:hypothetical protein
VLFMKMEAKSGRPRRQAGAGSQHGTQAQQRHLAKFELPRCRHLRPHLGRALAKRIRCACAMCRQVTHALLMLQGNCTHHHVIAMRELLEGWAA